ncbi:hypothetical protein DYB35_003627 [Aphanomyces astaci]|uniref:JmjC domain-containing protein n=2 Tax=Aphanomyces astaci TaxID=112090 RepID=A0A418D688_APHAT|nr:hypothetical protein DYB35_003627 [Aphanomyces astaci]
MAFPGHPTSASIKQQCSIGESTIPAGTLVAIDWARSSWLQLFVRVTSDASGIEGLVHPQFVALPHRDQPPSTSFTSHDTSWTFDAVFDPSFTGCQLPLHFSTTPLIVDSNLQSLVWPLHVYNQKAFVVHGSTHRLETLRQDLHQFDVSALIQNASRTIAWLKQTRPPYRMQYLDVSSPDIAAACYAAGHSLYFNPSPEDRYIRAICADLGLNFTSGLLDGGIGGDIELFAVQSKHHTPWHFDAQHNFTVQLTGTKEWSYAKGPLTDPMSNLHLSSSNTASVLVEDTLAHAMAGAADLTPPTSSFETVTLRPGSVLYLPAGYWHSVTSFDEASQPAWRERPDFSQGPDHARAQWKARLEALATTIQAMADEVNSVFPDALFQEPDGDGDDAAAVRTLEPSDDSSSEMLSPLTVLTRSPVHVSQLVTTRHNPLEYTIAMGGYRKFADGCKAETQTTVRVPSGLKPVVEVLRVAAAGTTWTLGALEDQVPDAATTLLLSPLRCLVDLLVQSGYLQVADDPKLQ